jgi:hypothetical protein
MVLEQLLVRPPSSVAASTPKCPKLRRAELGRRLRKLPITARGSIDQLSLSDLKRWHWHTHQAGGCERAEGMGWS